MTMTQTNPFDGVKIVEPAPATSPSPIATERQRNYLVSLITHKTQDGTRTFSDELQEAGVTPDEFVDSLPTRQLVSDTISRLRDLPNFAGGEIPEGFHTANDRIYKVQRSGNGNLYAKMLDVETGRFEYVGRTPFALLSVETVLTIEKAKAFGKLYGVCCRCGATLTDETSIENGIGPICAGRF
jgi:hypothetical protein